MKDHLIFLKESLSTNSYLQAGLGRTEKPEEDYAVATFRQSAGRGQRGNHWESQADKNIAYSLLFHPRQLPASRSFVLSQCVSLAMCRLLQAEIGDVRIKWPNDIYYGNGKLAGILIENSLRGMYVSDTIIGIGLNVNQEQFYSDAPNPISMKQISAIDYSLEKLCKKLHEAVLSSCRKGCHPQASHEIKKAYMEHLYRRDGFYLYRDKSDDSLFEAEIADVEDNGLLCLRKRDGDIRSFAFKEVAFE